MTFLIFILLWPALSVALGIAFGKCIAWGSSC